MLLCSGKCYRCQRLGRGHRVLEKRRKKGEKKRRGKKSFSSLAQPVSMLSTPLSPNIPNPLLDISEQLNGLHHTMVHRLPEQQIRKMLGAVG